MMQSALLEGLSREPDTSVLEQLQAWDDADVLQKFSGMLRSGGATLLPHRARRQLAELARLLPGSGDERRDHLRRFSQPFDARLMKLTRLCEHVGIAIDEKPGHAFLNRAALQIERAMVEVLRRDDERGPVERCLRGRRRGFEGYSVHDAARYVLERLFDQLARQFESLSEADRRRAAEKIVDEIDRLDPATRAQIRDKLNIDRLGADALLKTGAIAALGTGLSAAVAIGGFGAYTLLTSTIATIAGFFGLSLPFGFYLLATSTLAFLANPLTVAGLVLGGGMLLRSRTNRAIRDRYLTVLVTLAVVAQANPSEHARPEDAFVSHAGRRYSEFIRAGPRDRRAYRRAFPAFREARAG